MAARRPLTPDKIATPSQIHQRTTGPGASYDGDAASLLGRRLHAAPNRGVPASPAGVGGAPPQAAAAPPSRIDERGKTPYR